MTSITKQVWRFIDEDPALRRDLARGVINVSGLAAYLKKQHKIPGSLDSVISAVRRYRRSDDIQEEHEAVRKALLDAVVTTKTRITILHLKNSSNLYKYISDLMRDPGFYKSEIFRLIKTRNETLCIIDQESLTRARTFFPEGNIIRVETGLAELSLSLTKEGWNSKGVLARLSNELASHDVVIQIVLTAEPKLSLYLEEEALSRAHDAVLSLTRA